MATKSDRESVMSRIAAAFEASGLSRQELGERMGYAPDTARKSVWQFFRTADPRVSMVVKFAKAVGVPIESLIREEK
jgi:transcriptional regulator with XRE-family HTH domain